MRSEQTSRSSTPDRRHVTEVKWDTAQDASRDFKRKRGREVMNLGVKREVLEKLSEIFHAGIEELVKIMFEGKWGLGKRREGKHVTRKHNVR